MVKGYAIVSLTPLDVNFYQSIDKQDPVIRRIKIDGKGAIEFDVIEDLKVKFDEYQNNFNYQLKAIVTEELTGEILVIHIVRQLLLFYPLI